jgi:hypothetical protein
MEDGPLTMNNGSEFPSGQCCAVQRKKVNYYLAMSAGATGDPPVAAFHRFIGRNGLDDWEDAGYTTGINVSDFSWMEGFLCPDPHFEGPTSSNMTLFFSAITKESDTTYPPGSVVMRATSTDDGVSWSVDSAPVLVGDGTYCPYMPSYVEFQGRHLMAVAWICVMAGVHPQILVFESADGVTGWYPIATAVTQGDCAAPALDWDDGAVDRPRMILDPTGSKILMLFSGYTWDGDAYNGAGAISRSGASLGVAVSANGCDWAVAPDPILSPSDSEDWDQWSTIIPSLTYTNDAKTKLRVYYHGRGPGYGNGASAAAQRLFAELELPECPSTQPCWSELGQPPVAPQVELSDLGRAQITANPNPTTGSVAIGLDLSRVRKIGNADVAIFDVTGRAVRTLWEGSAPSAPSTIQWDGRESSGSRVSAGNYLVRVRVAGEIVGTHLITHIR